MGSDIVESGFKSAFPDRPGLKPFGVSVPILQWGPSGPADPRQEPARMGIHRPVVLARTREIPGARYAVFTVLFRLGGVMRLGSAGRPGGRGKAPDVDLCALPVSCFGLDMSIMWCPDLISVEIPGAKRIAFVPSLSATCTGGNELPRHVDQDVA